MPRCTPSRTRRGCSRPVGHLRRGGVGRAEAQHVRVEDRPGAQARADDVAVHADDAGDGAAVGIERRGRVVGLHLEAQERLPVERDDAGVVVEDRAQEPAPAGEPLGGRADVRLEQRVDRLLPAALAVADRRVEDLVLAVLRPGLGDHLQLDVGHRAARAAPPTP